MYKHTYNCSVDKLLQKQLLKTYCNLNELHIKGVLDKIYMGKSDCPHTVESVLSVPVQMLQSSLKTVLTSLPLVSQKMGHSVVLLCFKILKLKILIWVNFQLLQS